MILSVTSGSVAWMVAVRGTSHRMPISPTKASRPTSATFKGAVRRIDQHVRRTGQHDIGGVGLVALVEQRLPRLVLRALRSKGQQLQLRRLDLGE